MAPRLFVAMTAVLALLCGCAQNPRPRPPRLARGPTTQSVEWPSTFPSTAPVVRRDFSVTPMRTGSLAPRPLFFVRETVTFHNVERVVKRAIDELQAAADTGRVQFVGPPVLRYV